MKTHRIPSSHRPVSGRLLARSAACCAVLLAAAAVQAFTPWYVARSDEQPGHRNAVDVHSHTPLRHEEISLAPNAALEAHNPPRQTELRRPASGFEPFISGFEPPCTTGYIGGGGSGLPVACNGWHASGSVPPGGFTQPVIAANLPAYGIQHLHFEYDPAQPIGDPDYGVDVTRNWALSDYIVPPPLPGVVTLSLLVRISGFPGGNSYIIQAQSHTQSLISAVMMFEEGGLIRVGDDDNPSDANFLLVPNSSGTQWTADQYIPVAICLDVDADRIAYFYDGKLIHSTGAGEDGYGGGVFAGTIIDNVVIRFEGNAPDDTTLDVDDVAIEPDNCPEAMGACCNYDGAGGCQLMPESACVATATGQYGGANSICSPVLCAALGVCGMPGSGSCFMPGGTGSPGCEQLNCCIAVCLENPLCCALDWDSACAETAQDACLPLPLCPYCGENCTDNSHCQQLATFEALNSTDSLFSVAEGFSPVSGGLISSICWWGAYLPGNVEQDAFRVRYYDCMDGVPKNVLAEFSQGATLNLTGKQDSGYEILGVSPIYEYTATHPALPVAAGEKYFIEIVNDLNDAEQWFWETSYDAQGDGVAYHKIDGLPYARFLRTDHDLALCINVELADPEPICPVPPPQPCQLSDYPIDVQEGEACGAQPDANAGCSLDPDPLPLPFTEFEASIDPHDPTLIHGQSWADGGSLDPDWYRFEVNPAADLNGDQEVVACVKLASELPMAAGVVLEDQSDGECGAVFEFNVSAIGFECGSSLAVGYVLQTGMHDHAYLYVRPEDGLDFLDGAPCGGDGQTTLGNSYVMQIALADQFEDCFCAPDLNGDGDVNAADLAILLGNWGPNPGHPADLNYDGLVGAADLAYLLGNWGSPGCN